MPHLLVNASLMFVLAQSPPATAPRKAPVVSSPSSRLEVRVEPASGTDVPYRLVVVNKSSQAVVALRYAFEGSWNTPPVQGVRRSPVHLPLIAPSDTYELPLVTSVSRAFGSPTPPSWVPTLVLISAVLWADGQVEGDPRLGADERALDVGEERQLARVIEVLKAVAQAPDAHALQALQAEISGLPTIVSVEEAATIHATLPKPALISEYEVRATMTEGMQKVQRAALREIGQRAGLPAAATGYDEWLRALLSDFEAWRTRVAKGER